MTQILGKCVAEIEQHLHAMNLSQTSPHGLAIVGLLDVLVTARASRDSVSLTRVVHKVIKYSHLFTTVRKFNDSHRVN